MPKALEKQTKRHGQVRERFLFFFYAADQRLANKRTKNSNVLRGLTRQDFISCVLPLQVQKGIDGDSVVSDFEMQMGTSGMAGSSN